MTQRVYVIYDLISLTWIGQLVTGTHDGPIIRMFHDVLSNPESICAKHPGDYTLRYVGDIGADGTLIPTDEPTTIATGASWEAARGSN